VAESPTTSTVQELGHAGADAAMVSLRETLPAELQGLFDRTFVRSHLLYEEFICRLVLQVVRTMDLTAALAEGCSAREIVDRGRLDPDRAPIAVDWMLRLLAERGFLEALPGTVPPRYRSRGPLPAPDPVPVREEQRRHDPSCLPAYVLAETVAADYPAFLRGEAAGEDLLFSPRRLRLWIEYFSNDNGLYAVNNRLAAAALTRWLPREGATILELGGGLASGAMAALEGLDAAGRLEAIREYRFTEFVPAFLRLGQGRLQARYRERPRLTFGALDMNRPFAEQGVAPGSLTVVYAVNTLHVAHDLGFTLGEVLRSLEPGGLLVISECIRPYPLQPTPVEFMFNLTRTFQSPRLHPVYRPTGGFLTPEQWQGALEATGFRAPCFFPDVMAIREQVRGFFVAAIGATRARD
jgi:SAM-dependent methyltransferase